MVPKFRAWDKAIKEMIPWRMLLNVYNLRNVFIRPETCGLVLMQSTGLKDKNGVEIFEGDLVKPKRDEPFVVKHFIKGQGIIKNVDIGAYGHSFEGIYSGEELEVIGNIYENPELLEPANE